MALMYDSVNAGAMPGGEAATAGYIDGLYNDSAAMLAKFPGLPHVTIAVFASDDADCLDIENGDATIAQAPGWVDRQHARGLRWPIVYSSASNTTAIRAALGSRAYLLWTAHYDGNPHICGGCGYPAADATQFLDRGPNGENVDQTLMSAAFLTAIGGTPTPASPTPTPTAPSPATVYPASKGDAMRIVNIYNGTAIVGQSLETEDGETHLQTAQEVEVMTRYIANLDGDPSDVLNTAEESIAHGILNRVRAGQ